MRLDEVFVTRNEACISWRQEKGPSIGNATETLKLTHTKSKMRHLMSGFKRPVALACCCGPLSGSVATERHLELEPPKGSAKPQLA